MPLPAPVYAPVAAPSTLPDLSPLPAPAVVDSPERVVDSPGSDPTPQFDDSPVPLPELAPLSFSSPSSPSNDCECPPGRKRPKRPSNVIARVTEYARRLSQNSLDNLKRGRPTKPRS